MLPAVVLLPLIAYALSRRRAAAAAAGKRAAADRGRGPAVGLDLPLSRPRRRDDEERPAPARGHAGRHRGHEQGRHPRLLGAAARRQDRRHPGAREPAAHPGRSAGPLRRTLQRILRSRPRRHAVRGDRRIVRRISPPRSRRRPQRRRRKRNERLRRTAAERIDRVAAAPAAGRDLGHGAGAAAARRGQPFRDRHAHDDHVVRVLRDRRRARHADPRAARHAECRLHGSRRPTTRSSRCTGR